MFVRHYVNEPVVEDFIMRNEDHSYTETYRLFLNDYYLDPVV